MDDVHSTLSDLERKLKELERELEAVGRSGEADVEPAYGGWSPPTLFSTVTPAEPPAGATPADTGGRVQEPPPQSPEAAAPVPLPSPTAPWEAVAAWQAPADQPPPAPIPAPPPAAPPSSPETSSPEMSSRETSSPETASLDRQLDELVAFRERLVASTNELVGELSRVLSDLGAEVAPPPAAPPPPPDPAETILDGRITVQAGPFPDVTTLAAFEQALERTPGVEDVYVRALDAGQATIEVALGHPVALAAALRPGAPLPFVVTAVGDGRLALALAGPDAPAAP